MSADVHTLTGAYALDALDELERRRFEDHLVECEDCRREVDEFRATAARLALAVGEQPHDELRRQVLARIGDTRQESPGRARSAAGRRPVNRWAVRLTAAAAAVALAAAVAFGTIAVHNGHQLGAVRSELDQARATYLPVAQVLGEPDAKVATATSTAGGRGLVISSRTLDRAVLLASGMPAAPNGRVYQAWLLGNGGARSVGLLRPGPGNTIPPLQFPAVTTKTLVGVTVEPAGGSTHPTTNPIMLIGLST
jgi:anti-sigma-K factor RskA